MLYDINCIIFLQTEIKSTIDYLTVSISLAWGRTKCRPSWRVYKHNYQLFNIYITNYMKRRRMRMVWQLVNYKWWWMRTRLCHHWSAVYCAMCYLPPVISWLPCVVSDIHDFIVWRGHEVHSERPPRVLLPSQTKVTQPTLLFYIYFNELSTFISNECSLQFITNGMRDGSVTRV